MVDTFCIGKLSNEKIIEIVCVNFDVLPAGINKKLERKSSTGLPFTMFYDDDKLVALLPASKHGDELRSHGGLTYGGLIVDA